MEINKLPSWLSKQDEYEPNKINNRFIEKSILSMISLLSTFRLQEACFSKKRSNASIKMAAVISVILMIACSDKLAFLYGVGVFILVRLCLLSAPLIRKVISSTASASIVTVILLLPAYLLGSRKTVVFIAIKITESLLMIHMFSVTTQWNEITKSLKAWHVPDVFLFTLDLTLKYIVMLGEVGITMLTALKLRTYGKKKARGVEQSHIVGMLFLQSKQISEEMYEAMICRGYTGEYMRPEKKKIQCIDGIRIFGIFLLFTFFIYTHTK